MDGLTDDMKAVLRAAYRLAPNGETFYIEQLSLDDLSERARTDCYFTLSRKWNYLEPRNADSNFPTSPAFESANDTASELAEVGLVADGSGINSNNVLSEVR